MDSDGELSFVSINVIVCNLILYFKIFYIESNIHKIHIANNSRNCQQLITESSNFFIYCPLSFSLEQKKNTHTHKIKEMYKGYRFK